MHMDSNHSNKTDNMIKYLITASLMNYIGNVTEEGYTR